MDVLIKKVSNRKDHRCPSTVRLKRNSMATKIAKLKIKREKNRMYFIKDGAVVSVPRAGSRGKRKKEATFGTKASMDYSKQIYFLDKDGDVAVAKRKNSGKKATKKTKRK